LSDLVCQLNKTLISQLPFIKNPNGAFFARDEAVWIQTLKYPASNLRELFEVKDGGLK